jgi:hypothetical protein
MDAIDISIISKGVTPIFRILTAILSKSPRTRAFSLKALQVPNVFTYMKKFYGSITLFSVVALGAWAARSWGWYNEYWFTDIALHVIAGIALGLLWLSLLGRSFPYRHILLLSTISFAVFGSVLWEFWEWGGWFFFPAYTDFYVPSYTDTLGDITCGLCGGIVADLAYAFRKEK